MNIIIPALLMLHSAPAYAGGGFVAGSVNLILFLVLIFALARKPLQKALKRRSDTIKRELAEAKEQLEQAKAKQAEVEQQLATMSENIANLRAESDKQIEQMRVEFAAKAQRDAQAIEENAKRTVEDEILRAQDLLKKETTQKAIELAREILKGEFNAEDQSKLFQSFTQAVEESSHV